MTLTIFLWECRTNHGVIARYPPQPFMTMHKIDKNAYQPVYSQLVDILKNEIDSGTYPPGSWLPSEAKLKALYDVSSVTVRRAVRILVEQGLVETTRGKGTIVKCFNLDKVSFDLTRLHDLFKPSGKTRISLLDRRVLNAGKLVAEKLGIRTGAKALHLRRMVIRGDTPILYHHQHLRYDPKQPLGKVDLKARSLRAFLECLGSEDFSAAKGNIKRGIFTLKVAAMDKEEAEYFNTREGAPAFHLEHLCYNLKDQVGSWGYFSFFDEDLVFSARVGTWCQEA